MKSTTPYVSSVKFGSELEVCIGGPFFVARKVLTYFGKKEKKSITAERYSESTVLLIHEMVSMRLNLVVMQDNASAHSAA